MRKVWFGGDGQSGARDFGANYIRGLQQRQIRFARRSITFLYKLHERLIVLVPLLEQANPIFDLTVLLTTGKPSTALSDFNQTGDLTSERVRVVFFGSS